MTKQWSVGDLIDERFEVGRILAGGMGVVYIVLDRVWGKVQAAKTYRDDLFVNDPDLQNRFEKEALAWVKLDIHPNVTRALGVQPLGGRVCLILEYVDGGDLSNWIRSGRLANDLRQVLQFAIQFCDGMTHALSRGIKAHRDIKPANCLISTDLALKITDFGLAAIFGVPTTTARTAGTREPPTRMHVDVTRAGVAAGTPPYMAPEQFDAFSGVDVRADVYSFGVMLCEMLTGSLPFVGETWQQLKRAHQVQPPPKLAGVPAEMNAIVQRCLAKDRASRYGNFADLRPDLVRVYESIFGERLPVPGKMVPLDPIDHYSKGLSLARLGEHGDAIRCFDSAIAARPGLADVWYYKGLSLMGAKRLDDALTTFDRALQVDPLEAPRPGAWRGRQLVNPTPSLSRAQLYLGKGVVLLDLERYEEALDCFNRATDLDGENRPAWRRKAMALVQLGQFAEARTACQRGLALGDPEAAGLLRTIDAEQWSKKGTLALQSQRFSQAVECFDHVIEIDKEHSYAWANKALALKQLERWREAAVCIDRAVALDPLASDFWALRGNILLHADPNRRMNDVVASYQKAVDMGHAASRKILARLKETLR